MTKKRQPVIDLEKYTEWKVAKIRNNPGERSVPTDARDYQRYRRETGR